MWTNCYYKTFPFLCDELRTNADFIFVLVQLQFEDAICYFNGFEFKSNNFVGLVLVNHNSIAQNIQIAFAPISVLFFVFNFFNLILNSDKFLGSTRIISEGRLG
jgi:hypothetical protein